jgi:hypothetical protein
VIRVEDHLSQEAWHLALLRLPLSCRDIYFTADYLEAHAANGDGRLFSMEVGENGNMLMVTGMLVPIPAALDADRTIRRYDIQTCNGYGGPIASTNTDSTFLGRAWNEWRNRCRAMGVVAAFFRLHPVLENERWLPSDARIVADRQTVFVDLAKGYEAAWQSAESRHRNMVNKGRRDGVCVAWDDPSGWDDFEALYRNAMIRLDAPDPLRFGHAYFARLRLLPGVELACIRSNGILDAAAVFMFGPCWCHYHLSARRDGAGNHLTSCLLQAALERAEERGLQGFHLGGGRTKSGSDSLLRFKLSLGGRLLNFKVALVVADSSAYDELCARWSVETGEAPQWLLGYRQPKPGGR